MPKEAENQTMKCEITLTKQLPDHQGQKVLVCVHIDRDGKVTQDLCIGDIKLTAATAGEFVRRVKQAVDALEQLQSRASQIYLEQ